MTHLKVEALKTESCSLTVAVMHVHLT